jgi:hypothetical protein
MGVSKRPCITQPFHCLCLLQVATFLLKEGLPHMEGVVFLDNRDRQCILLRGAAGPVSLKECGLDKSRRFTFYDQVSTLVCANFIGKACFVYYTGTQTCV